jgi:hypothetical protein
MSSDIQQAAGVPELGAMGTIAIGVTDRNPGAVSKTAPALGYARSVRPAAGIPFRAGLGDQAAQNPARDRHPPRDPVAG